MFKLHSEYKPTGDQPQAIEYLSKGIEQGKKFQTLLGVTGSGKTFTMANIIQNVQKPTLVLAHNKTLAGQLYSEFKEFFPENHVEYFVSYYDYYQPESYIAQSDTYIEKDTSINDEIDKLRHSATASLFETRDVIIVASVSCIYGLGDPIDYENMIVSLRPGMEISRDKIMKKLINMQYSRNEIDFKRGTFRAKGDILEIYPSDKSESAIRAEFWGDEIEKISEINPVTGKSIGTRQHVMILPNSHYVTSKDKMERALKTIEEEMNERVAYFKSQNKLIEAQRIQERTNFDMEMMKELGHCSGIENYSRYFDGREAGQRPYCLLDFFPKDYLMFIDESHVSVPQISAMYGGDRARKQNLVEYGFRLPAAFDNRPLKFDEFMDMVNQVVYVSATPANFEMNEAEGVVVEQIIRPTGLLDPIIEVRPSENQIDDLLEEIQQRCEVDERVLVTTLTKRMAEELTEFLLNHNIRANYIHSDVATLDRVQIMNDLRAGMYDVLVGVNLLREGLDLPEVSLVAILDADKEGFLRSHRSLTQTAGRAARNINGKVIMYADNITASMQQTIDETARRRQIQLKYNADHGITPQQIRKDIKGTLSAFADAQQHDTEKPTGNVKAADNKQAPKRYQPYIEPEGYAYAADPIVKRMTRKQLEKSIADTTEMMKEAARQLDFLQAAQYRDEIVRLQSLLDEETGK